MIDYLQIIHKYIPPDSKAYKYYIVHVTLVTQKALSIARSLGLSEDQLEFIEEAAMLHDIGIIKTNLPLIECFGTEPYIKHMPIGKQILLKESLPKHAEIAEKHTSITNKQIMRNGLELEPRDIYPTSIEGEIIAFCDKFFTKEPQFLWQEKPIELVRQTEENYGVESKEIFDKWLAKFGEYI